MARLVRCTNTMAPPFHTLIKQASYSELPRTEVTSFRRQQRLWDHKRSRSRCLPHAALLTLSLVTPQNQLRRLSGSTTGGTGGDDGGEGDGIVGDGVTSTEGFDGSATGKASDSTSKETPATGANKTAVNNKQSFLNRKGRRPPPPLDAQTDRIMQTKFIPCPCGGLCSFQETVAGNCKYFRCEKCHQMHMVPPIQQQQQETCSKEEPKQFHVPKSIKAYLDQYVIGQDHPKKLLSVAVYKHFKRVTHSPTPVAASNASAANTGGGIENEPPSAIYPGPMHFQSSRGDSYPSMMTPHGIHFGSIGDLLGAASGGVKDDGRRGAAPTMSAPGGSAKRNTADNRLEQTTTNTKQTRLEKSNILMIGPTGVGKTFLAKIVANCLDVPFVMQDCTPLTSAGYVGEDVESVISKLLAQAGGDIDRAQHGVVFLDEVDKIRSNGVSIGASSNRDIGGEGVQQALLKMVEGTIVQVNAGPGRKMSQYNGQESATVDTTNVLFIASGAFAGLEKIIAKRTTDKSVGFGLEVDGSPLTKKATVDTSQVFGRCRVDELQAAAEEQVKRDELFKQVEPSDIVQYGMIPEFVGRFPVVAPFAGLTEQDLYDILVKPKNSLVAQFKEHFALDDVGLIFEDLALMEIARQALRRKTGARGLRGIMEKVLHDPSYEVPGSDVSEVRITHDTVSGGAYQCSHRPSKTSAAVG